MKLKQILNYDTPQVEIIEVEVEKGFAGSVEIGRLLKELEQLGKFRLKRSLRAVFTMERYGFFAYLSDPKRAKKIFAAQNMDGFCSKTYSIGGMPLSFFMSPVCNPFFGDVLQKKCWTLCFRM